MRASNLLSGRALETEEIGRLFEICSADGTAKGARDAAIFAVFYGCGLRRGKQRTVYLTADGCEHVGSWLRHRGDVPGPLFRPIRQTGEIPLTRMRGESIAYILRRRQEQAGVEPFSPHDIRRSTVTHLLDAGVDVFAVQRLAGHADATTTARYDRRGERAKRRAVQNLRIPALAA